MKISTTSPRAAALGGQSLLTGGQTLLKSLLCRIAPGPLPFISHVKIPGENGTTETVNAALVTLPLDVCTCTWIVALVAPTNSIGNCALIPPGAAEKRGAATPLTSSVAPASVVGSVELCV